MNNRKIILSSIAVMTFTVVGIKIIPSPDDKSLSPQAQANSASKALPVMAPEVRQRVASFKPTVMTPDEVFISQGVQSQMADIAETYEENMRYPAYSTPLNTSDWTQLHPRAFVPKAVALDFNESISAELIFEQYVVADNQPVPVRLTIHGVGLDRYGDEVSPVGVSISAGKFGEEVNLTMLSQKTQFDGIVSYQGEISSAKLSQLELGENLINADISFSNNEQARVSAVLKVASDDATLVRLDAPYIDGANLIIPAKFTVRQNGFYRLEANLFDKKGEQPISHLNASFMLDAMHSEGLIKVHASTLRAKGDPGPYLLTDINLTRGPAKPGDKTGYGTSRKESFEVQGFALDSYSREEYVDPKAQQRLEFLQKMAGIN